MADKPIVAREVDPQGNCSACGGIHYGTGSVCVYKQTFPEPKLEAKPLTVAQELLEAAKPFRRVLEVNVPWLNSLDERELVGFLPVGHPTWGEFKRLMTAISVIDEARKRVTGGE